MITANEYNHHPLQVLEIERVSLLEQRSRFEKKIKKYSDAHTIVETHLMAVNKAMEKMMADEGDNVKVTATITARPEEFRRTSGC